jgi:membrane protein implicated in regulation of membrane protease activity
MTRFAAWLSRNADGAIALALAIVLALLVLADIVQADRYVTAATLIVLALLATTLLQDRARAESGEKRTEEVTQRTLELLERMPDAKGIAELRETVASARKAMDDSSMVRIVPGEEVRHVLQAARQDTDRWFFKGGTGTFLRAVTLPECVALARREKRTLKLQIEIIDPTDDLVCRRYAEYRRSLSDGTGEAWTTDRTRKESFATIVAVCWYRQHFTFLDVTLGLSSVMTTFRWDMSSRFLVITQEDPNGPALVADAGRPYYRAWDRELHASLEQARRVPLDRVREVELSEEPTIDEVRKLLRAVGSELPHAFGDPEASDIIRRAIKAPNPYE